MLLPLSVYCRRIESQPRISEDVQENFATKFTHFSSRIHQQESIKIILFFAILNLILPAMGSAQLFEEMPAGHQLSLYDGIKRILNNNAYTNENSHFKEDGSILQTKKIKMDYKQNEVLKINKCLLCRIIAQKKLGESRLLILGEKSVNTAKSQRTILSSQLFEASEYMNNIESRRTFKPENFKSSTLVRKRRDVGDRRRKRLYSDAGGYILQIHPNGKVDGTRNTKSRFGIMMMHTVSRGKVRIQSEATGLFLAMSNSGKLYGSVVYNPRYSDFEEKMAANFYSTYSLLTRRGLAYIGLSKRGKPKKGTKTNPASPAAHFLPLDAA